jgi:hypothetical protein
MPGAETSPSKKKSKKLPIIIAAVAAVIVIIIIAASMGGGDRIDYVATVKAHQPFRSQDMPYTYGDVFNKYIQSAEWISYASGDLTYVDVSGTVVGTASNLVVTISVAPNPNNPDGALINPVSLKVGTTRTQSQNEAVEALLDIFSAYDEGWEDISEFPLFY